MQLLMASKHTRAIHRIGIVWCFAHNDNSLWRYLRTRATPMSQVRAGLVQGTTLRTMPTIKITQQTHQQLRQLARQHGQSMKQLVEKLIALLSSTRQTPEALAQQVHEHQTHVRLEAVLAKSEQKLQQSAKAQQAVLVMLLEKVSAFTNETAMAALQNTLERIELLAKDQKATLEAMLD